MSPKRISAKQNTIKNSLGTYHRAVETADFIFFVNYREGDENHAVKMYSKSNLVLVSDNYHCYNDMFVVLLNKRFTYLSSTMRINFKLAQGANQG